jgi:DNA-binding response OmpR family regulator
MADSRKKVIIFDDDEDITSICSYILEERGFEVHIFNDCRDAAKNVIQIRPDVVIMDNWIPDEGGIIATQTIKNTPSIKNTPVIYFSANSDIQSLARQAGADTFLAKPFVITDSLKSPSA